MSTSTEVTESVKIGIDSLVSQVLKYYKAYYSPYITELPSSPPPSPPPVSTSPPVTSPLTMSTSYSSFYSYTRTLSQGDITTIIDPFDSVPSSSSYASFPIEYSEESVSDPVSHWSWFRFLLVVILDLPHLSLPLPNQLQLVCCLLHYVGCLSISIHYVVVVSLETVFITVICSNYIDYVLLQPLFKIL